MMRQASYLSVNAGDTYRAVDLAGRTGGADPHQLVELLYDEAIRALGTAAWAAEARNYRMKSERVTRATAILFALEAGLDFERGGEVSRTLQRLYQGLRDQIVHASIDHDPAPFRAVAASLSEIAEAWRSVRGA